MKNAITRIVLTSALLATCVLPGRAYAEEAKDIATCTRLNEASAYGDKEDDMYMIPGKGNWIFRSGTDFRSEFVMPAEIRALLKNFKDVLSKNGTDLVIAFTPTRGMISDGLIAEDQPHAKEYNAAKARAAYKDYIASLQKDGIHMVGTPDIKAGPAYFYKSDHHWSAAGAKEMAEAVAQEIKKLPSYKNIEKIKYKTAPGKTVDFDGTFNATLEKICGYRLAKETDQTDLTTEDADNTSESALFSDSKAPDIVLVGTSNSKRKVFDSNFDGYLKQFLSADVYNAAIPAAGITDPFIAYLNSESYKEHKPKVIVWEIPGYYRATGEVMETALRQLLPTAAGECKKPLAARESIKIDGETSILMSDLADKKIDAAQTYLSLDFDKPVKKSFQVTFKNVKNEREKFKLKRSKRYPYDGQFYIAPEGKSRAPLAEISLTAPAEMKGLTAKITLCPLPVKTRTPAE